MSPKTSQEQQHEEQLEQELATEDVAEESSEEVVVDWQAEAEKNLDGWKRAQADYQNLKKQSEIEKQEVRKYASAGVIDQMIPVFDNFALAIKHCPEELAGNGWVQGILYIEQQWNAILSEQGVEVIMPKIGEDFDPETQEAVETTQDGDGTVSEVLQNGYKMHERVIRPARVKVS